MPRDDEALGKREGEGQLSEETRKEVFVEKERSASSEEPGPGRQSGHTQPKTVGADIPGRGM